MNNHLPQSSIDVLREKIEQAFNNALGTLSTDAAKAMRSMCINQIMSSVKAELGAAIGEDENFTNIQMVDGSGKPTSKLYEEAFSPYQIARNQLRQELRNHFGIGKTDE